jgi:hypothetical protein
MTTTNVLLYDQVATFEVSKEIPSNAKHVITLEWTSSPINYMKNRYMISKDISNQKWLLWIKADETEDESFDQLVAFENNSDIDIKDASANLLKAYWIAYYKEYETPDEHYKLVETGILDEHDLKNIVSGINFM